ncbi:MAG: hypothetical protein JNN04_05685 [Cyclobacteriaceae bacterium]|nr:hypothetical protein [Cyclobacteriaceae bacterium]
MLFTFGTLSTLGQPSNSWINFSQTYYKVRVGATGIHRLTYADLQGAGVPVGSLDPRRINLFHRGVEQAIVVAGESDAVFDPADYIEFYGTRNDGTLDVSLYEPAASQPHSFYNLYSDTTAYFLTWNPLPVAGKRMVSFFEVNTSGIPAEVSHDHEDLQVFAQEFSFVAEPQPTAFVQGEAWTGETICTLTSGCTGQKDFLVENLLGGVSFAGSPTLEIQLNGRSELFHNAEVYAGPHAGALRLLGSTSFFRFETPILSLPLAWTDIGIDGKMTIRVKIIVGTNRDALSVSYLRVRMPQDFNARLVNGKRLQLKPNAGGKSFILVQNPPASARVFDITDPDNVRIIGTVPVSGGFSAVVPGTANGRTLYLTSTVLAAPIQKVTFRSFAPSAHDYLIITHRVLMKPALGYPNAVRAYAEYRASAEGGGYDTLTVTMDQLYDQFNYGEISPRAIHEFLKYMDSGGNPKFVFLVGKGVEVSLRYHRKTTYAPGDFPDLVPSAGIPAGDMAYTAGLSGSSGEPGIPIGRLTATTPVQVAAYLNKVKESEQLAFDALWRKDVLHLSGGIQAGEPELFRSFVDGFKAIAEDHYLGGQVQTISKQTLNVELINIKDQVNKGLNLITFYGHSGPGTIDIDIGYVSDPVLGYQNAGKYPGFLINGCNAGRFFDNRITFGEDWLLTPNKGAKSFIAHSSFGFINPLRQYSELFYQVAFGDSTFIHKGVGEVQREVARRYLLGYGNSTLSVSQVQQMMLIGDPAVSLFGANKPDYEVQAGAVSVVSFDDGPVTAQSDSFAIEFRVRNFGRTQPGPFRVRVRRTGGDGTITDYDSIYAPVLYSQVLRMVIRKAPGETASGNNLFAVMLDPNQDVPELSEVNNLAVINYFIASNGPRNIFPSPYAVVSGTSVELAFQHSDLASDVREFVVEVDTASAFGSPYLSRVTLSGKGLLRHHIPLLAADSLPYYWRTRLLNPLPGESNGWTTSSFTRIQGAPTGWAQVDFPQYVTSDTLGLTWNRATKRLGFLASVTPVSVQTYGSAHPGAPSAVSVKINGEEFNIATQGQQCRNHTLNLMAFDKSSAAPYAGIPFSLFDPRTCGREPQLINSFTVAEMDQALNGIAQWVANIKPGDSVVLFSIGDAGYASWTPGIKSALAQLGVGSSQLNGLQAGEPFVLLARKGASPGAATLFRPAGAPANAQPLLVDATVTGRNDSGQLTSGLIGPAVSWGDAHVRLSEVSPEDDVHIDVLGVRLSGAEVKLSEIAPGSSTLGSVDAAEYPYVKLVLNTLDSVNLTPAQLRHWLVSYTPAAEGILLFSGPSEPQHLEEGQLWTGPYGFVNVTGQPFTDSLTVRTDVLNRESRQLDRRSFRIAAPAPGDTTWFEVAVDTKGKGGLNDVTVYVNPRLHPELYYDNNLLPLYEYLEVEADETGPVLEVTIDGRRVVNGDAVSATPEIKARIIDRNPFLFKTDTTGVNLYLRFPCDNGSACQFRRITLSSPEVSWTPASLTEEFSVTYQPATLAAGDYLLRVEAADASGNLSGAEPFEVAFVVLDEEVFAVRAVYPNPSPDEFYFKLFMASSVPDDFQLEVFSSSGQSVQRFGPETLPLLHVGTNELSLKAADAQGNLLPPGIYLYRFTVSVEGKVFIESGRLVVAR